MRIPFFVLLIVGLIGRVHAQPEYVYMPAQKVEALASGCDEVSPYADAKGNKMYFVRAYCPENVGGGSAGQDIYVASLDSKGLWTKATNMGKSINTPYENNLSGVSADGKKVYLNYAIRDGKSYPGLSYIIQRGGDSGWTTPVEIILPKIKLRNESYIQYVVSRDEKHIFLSKPRNDTIVTEDLYVTHKTPKGWTEWSSLGETINTIGYETSPYLAPDDSTLYFSSNGMGGMGDADIFSAKRLDNTWKKWTKPQNLGKSINTKGFDSGFIALENGWCFYSTSENPQSQEADLYFTQKIRSTANILISAVNINTKNSIPAFNVNVINKDSKNTGQKHQSNNSKLSFSIPYTGGKYTLIAQSEGYVTLDYNFEINTPLINKDTTLVLELSPIEVGQVVRLNNIYFETGKSLLLEESFLELDVLVDLLQSNPTMEILISGHTDNKGNAKANLKLSEDRVKAVDMYLIEKGIDTKRLTYKGYGSSKPVADNRTEEGRAKNRRVEFTILKK